MRRKIKIRAIGFRRTAAAAFCFSALAGIVVASLVERGAAQGQVQGGGYERSFSQSKPEVEKALKEIPFALAGRLPVLDGFAAPGDRPLENFQRGYFQTTVQVTATATGGSVVRVNAKVTAWYQDAIAARSGYRLLPSNGRLEGDLLDELAGELEKRAANRQGNAGAGATVVAAEPRSTTPVQPPAVQPHEAETESATQARVDQAKVDQSKVDQARVDEVGAAQPKVVQSEVAQAVPDQPVDTAPAAPMPRLPETGTPSSALAQRLASQPTGSAAGTASGSPARENAELKAEADSLEEILKNQSHPRNLVAVKKAGTPVVDSPSLKAKTLFLASEHDEFEMLDFTSDWVHVRISGLSRGWMWRNALEMPSDIPAIESTVAAEPVDVFHVVREETSIFPGDWGPLQGKRVEILSVEMIDEKASKSTSQAKLEFAKTVLDQRYADLAKSAGSTGVVLMFDSADGGMLAVTLPVLQQWKAGTLTDAGLWHQSFFDPPETFGGSAGGSASQ